MGIVSCRELFEWNLPELTDEVVKSLNRPTLQTVEDLKSSLLMAEAGRRAEKLRDIIQDTLVQELVKIVDMEVSETALLETAKVKYQTLLLDMQSKVGIFYASRGNAGCLNHREKSAKQHWRA